MRVLFAAFLLAMLLTPIVSQTAGASGDVVIDPVILDQPLVLDEVTPEPVLDLVDIPIDPDILDDPVLVDPSSDVNDLYVNPLLCPYDVDLWSLDYYGLAQGCNLGWANGYELYVSDSASNPSFQQVIQDGPAAVTGLANDTYSLSLTHPASGYSPMRIICSGEDLQGNDIVPAYDLAVFEYGGPVNVSGGLLYWCDAFVVQDGPAAPPVDVTINKHGCLPGYNSSDMYELAANCDETLTGIEFTVTDGYGNGSTQATAGAPALASFSQVAGGQLSIQETIPGGYGEPIAFCRIEDFLGNNLGDYQIPAVSGGLFQIDASVADAASVWCDVYNFPDNDDSVTITKWECPDGVLYGQAVDYYLTECTEPMENVEFAHGEQGGLAELAYTDANGDLSFSVEPNKDWAVEERVPNGYGDPIVFCGFGAYRYDDFGGVIAIDGFANLDGSQGSVLEFSTYDVFGMGCNWFNIPHDDDQSITVYKYTCPAGYDLNAATADPQADCVELTNGVNFYLLPDGGIELQTMTGDSIDGAVYFGGVETGGFTIREDAPASTVDTYVTCQWYEDLGPYVYQQFEPYAYGGSSIGNAIDVELAYGDELICQWYNAPEKPWDGGDLTIYKYWCAGYVVSDANCELGSGVKFVISPLGGGGSILTETGPGGFSALSGLAAGAYSVTEKDYVWCKAVSSRVDADGNVVIEEGQETVLEVYNCTGDTETEKDPPVKKFPNTGAGDLTPGADDEIILLGGIVVLAQVMMLVALRGKGVTLQSAVARIRR